jgi:hypothetical protein
MTKQRNCVEVGHDGYEVNVGNLDVSLLADREHDIVGAM